MAHIKNLLGQNIGLPVADWTPPGIPSHEPMNGHFCRLEALNTERHAADLYAANAHDSDGRNWTYLAQGPFDSFDDYQAWVMKSAASRDPLFFAILDGRTDRAVGVASYLRIDAANGVVEIGSLNFSPLLQRTPAATEALYLMIERVFSQGYRRCEWKCDAMNEPSRRAAQRLGFTFEGVFRQAVIYKGRNRDTAWYAIIDTDWPALQAAFRRWLDPENFDTNGRQKMALSELTAPLLSQKV